MANDKIIFRKSIDKSLPAEIINGQILFDKDGYIAWDTVQGKKKTRILARSKELGTSDLGSDIQPIYLNKGKPVAGINLSSSIASEDVALGAPILPPGMTKIPTHLSDLQSDSNYMTVSQTEKDNWNSKSGGSGGSGTSDHSLLVNRNLPNQHTIESITNLRTELDKKLTQENLQSGINSALAQAKASGKFNGKDGAPGASGKDGENGAPGAAGKTPKKGIDYWTEEDKQSIINDILAALPKAKGVDF